MIRFPSTVPLKGRVPTNAQLADVAPMILAAIGLPVPPWMDGEPVRGVSQGDATRVIFGVSDVGARQAIAPLLRTLASGGGPPNYGAASVTMIAGERWFQMALSDGTFSSGELPGHTQPGRVQLPDASARERVLEKIKRVGFVVAGAGSH
jgi:hypothetical protein